MQVQSFNFENMGAANNSATTKNQINMKDHTTIFATVETDNAPVLHKKLQHKQFLETLVCVNEVRTKNVSNKKPSDESDVISVSSLSDLDGEIIKKLDECEFLDDWMKIRSKFKIERNNENIRKIVIYIKRRLDKMTEENKKKWTTNLMKGVFKDILPEFLIDLSIAQFFPGDNGIRVDTRPDWLDRVKFRKGQDFARNYLFSICYADLLSLIIVFSFEDALKPLVVTGASSTPYTAFKRYYSTQIRVRNWYMSDPWTPGTPAYNDVKTVRQMHASVRKRLENMTPEEITEKTKIKNLWCPAHNILKEDFQSTCPAPAPGQCPFTVLNEYPELKYHHLNQGEMVATQFAFVGLIVTYPKFFGVHDASDDDIEAFCHVWRGIGYLLGIDDEYNFCRGTLEDVRRRTKNMLEYWVKPNFRIVKPEWEHMMRCVVEGLQYYFPGTTYEMCVTDLAQMMNLHLPRFWDSMSYINRFKGGLIRFYFNQCCKISVLRYIMNYRLKKVLEMVKNFDCKKYKELEKRSTKTLNAYSLKSKQKEVSEKYSSIDYIAQI